VLGSNFGPVPASGYTGALLEHFQVVVIGGGQAGLATGFYLSRAGLSYVILDGGQRVGDPWRKRWDSLSLIHISEPTRPLYISYAVFCLKKK